MKSIKSNKLQVYLSSLDSTLDTKSLEDLTNPKFFKLFKKVNRNNVMGEKYSSIKKFVKSYNDQLKYDSRFDENIPREITFRTLLFTRDKRKLKRISKIVASSRLLLENYFGLKVNIETTNDLFIKKGKLEHMIIDNTKELGFPLIYNSNNNNYDVVRILDILMEYVYNLFSVIIFTDLNLYEDHPENEVFGRAYGGNGLAVVGVNDCTDREIIITAIHETMHTFGFEHCCLWDCIMNAKNDENYSSSNLCPADLIKLKIFNKIDIKARYKKLKEVYQYLRWEDDVKICDKLINYFK